MGSVIDQQLTTYGSTQTSARSQLYETGVRIADQHAPLGVGFGRFASAPSRDYYSDVYDLYGLSHVWGLSREFPRFIADTSWPSVIGETGYGGLAVFVAGLLALMLAGARGVRTATGPDALAPMALLCALAVLLVDSTGNPNLFSWNAITVIALLSGATLARSPARAGADPVAHPIVEPHHVRLLWADYRALYARKRPGAQEPLAKAIIMIAPRIAIDSNLHANLLVRARARRLLERAHGMRVDPRARIGGGLFLPHPVNIVIDGDTTIGEDVALFHNTTLRGATIGDRARIFTGATVLGCSVGVGATIGANAIVTEDVAPGGRVVWSGEGARPSGAPLPARAARVALLIGLQQRAPRLWRVWRRLLLCHGCDIGRDAQIGAGLTIPRPVGVVVGRRAVLGRQVVLQERATVTPTRMTFHADGGRLTVGDRVRVGAGAGVFGEVAIAR